MGVNFWGICPVELVARSYRVTETAVTRVAGWGVDRDKWRPRIVLEKGLKAIGGRALLIIRGEVHPP